MLKIFHKFKIKKIKYKNHKKGIALVIAITMTTLLLSISLSMSNIVLRQIKIANITNESKPAFYTADSGIECAFYYDTLVILDAINPNIDINKNFSTAIFGTSTAQGDIERIKCGLGGPLGLIKNINSDQSIVTTTFDINYGDKCAKVKVIKTDVETTIKSSGYNTGVKSDNSACDLTNLDKKNLVERGLTIVY